MIQLLNGCYCSELNVYPQNWKAANASTKKTWYISYRYYDPTAKDRWPKGRPVQVKGGMNLYKDVKQRQEACKALLENEKELLTEKSYNQITGRYMVEETIDYKISPSTHFIKALEILKKDLSYSESTMCDITSVIKGVKIAAQQLRLDTMAINDVKRRHIKMILEHCGKINPKFSDNRYNKYRAYLSMLFEELEELETVEANPVTMKKRETLIKVKILLSHEERISIDRYLKQSHYNFWRLLHIFFHSGARETEIVRLRFEDVDLINQRVKYLIKKGRNYREEYRVIKDAALPLWTEVISNALPGQFLFSKGLKPGDVSIKANQITRRWRVHVKLKMGINADFYSLKHLNTDETAALLDLKDASAHNSHKGTVVTMNHYALGEKERQNERLKKVKNAFA